MKKWQGSQPTLTRQQVAELKLIQPAYVAARQTTVRIRQLAQTWGVDTWLLRRYLRGEIPKRYKDEGG